jgi:hypothetical protein
MADAPAQGEEAIRRGGPEIDVGLFSRVQQLIQSVRLTQDERIVVQTGDVASDVHTARKEFELGHGEQALRAVTRFSSSFDQKVAQWESRARQKESQKLKMSMLQIRKMQAEHSAVRTRVELARAQVRRLRVGLDQLENAPRSQPAPAEADGVAAATQPPPAT